MDFLHLFEIFVLFFNGRNGNAESLYLLTASLGLGSYKIVVECIGRSWINCSSFFSLPVALQSVKDLGRLTYRRFLKLFRHIVGLLG
jgi:hypothetical protein